MFILYGESGASVMKLSVIIKCVLMPKVIKSSVIETISFQTYSFKISKNKYNFKYKHLSHIAFII